MSRMYIFQDNELSFNIYTVNYIYNFTKKYILAI